MKTAMTPRERRIFIESGKAKAAAIRYQLFCLAVGNLPPTRGEMERMEVAGVPEWFRPPKQSSTERNIWQRGRG